MRCTLGPKLALQSGFIIRFILVWGNKSNVYTVIGVSHPLRVVK